MYNFYLNSPCTGCFQTLFHSFDVHSAASLLTTSIAGRWHREYQITMPHDFSVPKPIPTFGTRSTRRWYSQYQALVLAIPAYGIVGTSAWYYVYQMMVSRRSKPEAALLHHHFAAIAHVDTLLRGLTAETLTVQRVPVGLRFGRGLISSCQAYEQHDH